MVAEVKMPALSPTMEEGKIISWNKKEGDKVEVGEVIFEVETDKAVMEVESQDKGVVGKIIYKEDEIVKVGEVLALLLEKNETMESINNYCLNCDKKEKTDKNNNDKLTKKEEVNILASKNNEQQSDKNIDNQWQKDRDNNRVFASPLAKKIAGLNNIDILTLSGSGPNGRIIKTDVENALKNTISRASVAIRTRNNIEYIDIEASAMRKAIAKRLLESKQQIPHFYMKIIVDMTNFVCFRAELNKMAKIIDGKPEYKISANDIIVLAVAKALKFNPKVNAIWVNDKIRQFNNIDISVAVSIEGGIYTPVIKNADCFDIISLSNTIKSLSQKAKNNSLKPEECNGGCLTISNLGMYNVSDFTSIINAPQSCIIAVGKIEQKPFVSDNGKCASKNGCCITFSADHRVIDGAVMALFVNDVKKLLENPALIFVV